MKKAILFIVIVLFTAACESTFVAPRENTGIDFYPEKDGFYAIYAIKEKNYVLNAQAEITTKERKEVYRQNGEKDGEKLLRIAVYERANGRDNWTLKAYSSARKSNSRVVRYLESTPFVKMSLPLEKNKSWDGNALNENREEPYVLTELGSEYGFYGKKFTDCAKILHRSDSNLVNKDVRYEIYARNIGMIYSYSETLDYCQEGACFGKYVAESGKSTELILLDYGTE